MKFVHLSIFNLPSLKRIFIIATPISIKALFVLVVLLSIYFIKNYLNSNLFNFYIEVTSVASIGQQFFRFGSNYKVFGLKDLNQLKDTQNKVITRSVLFGFTLLTINFIFFEDRSQINFLLGLIMGAIQVILSNQYSFATQNKSFLRAAIIDPSIVQIIFTFLTILVGLKVFNLELLKLGCFISFVLYLLFRVFKRGILSVKKPFFIENNELWSFITNIISLGGTSFALYIFANEKFNDINALFELKILERAIAISLLAPSALNPLYLSEKSNEFQFSIKKSLILAVLTSFGVIALFLIMGLEFGNNYWIILLLINILMVPFASYYGFILCVRGYANIILLTTMFGFVIQWTSYIIFKQNSILYGVTLNYFFQYLLPIVISKKKQYQNEISVQ